MNGSSKKAQASLRRPSFLQFSILDLDLRGHFWYAVTKKTGITCITCITRNMYYMCHVGVKKDQKGSKRQNWQRPTCGSTSSVSSQQLLRFLGVTGRSLFFESVDAGPQGLGHVFTREDSEVPRRS